MHVSYVVRKNDRTEKRIRIRVGGHSSGRLESRLAYITMDGIMLEFCMLSS